MSAARARRLTVVIFSDRPARAVALLRDGLGLAPISVPPAARRPGVTSFQVNGTRIDVVPDARAQDAVMLELAVDDLDAACVAISQATDLLPLGPIGLPWGGRLCGIDLPGGPALRLVEGAEGGNPPLPVAVGAGAGVELAVVACIDGHPDPLDALEVAPGGAHVITTPGGIVTDAVVGDLELARRSLGISRVAVVQHLPCAVIEGDRGVDPTGEPAMTRLRRSLDRLVRPPLAMPPDRVEGYVVWEDETVMRIGPVVAGDAGGR